MSDGHPGAHVETSRRTFWAGQAIGIVIMAFALRGILDARLGAPPSFFRFFLGGAVLHDAVVAPVVFTVAWAVKKVVPAWTWSTVRNALFVSVCAALFSYPYVRGFGRRPTNDTVVPRNYAEGLIIVLALVWAVAAAWLVRTWIDRRGQVSAGSDAAMTSRMSSP